MWVVKVVLSCIKRSFVWQVKFNLIGENALLSHCLVVFNNESNCSLRIEMNQEEWRSLAPYVRAIFPKSLTCERWSIQSLVGKLFLRSEQTFLVAEIQKKNCIRIIRNPFLCLCFWCIEWDQISVPTSRIH